MATLEISIYSAGVLVLLLSIPFFRAVFNKLESIIETRGNRRLVEKRITPPSSPIPGDPPSLEVFRESRYGADWWVDQKVFDLERRALFSTHWLYATHRSRFSKPGDYLTLSVAGFSFFLILGKDDVLRGFHNVCRHRAYEVTRKECGSSTVLGCRYHGWSYDTTGKLTKAPEFENVKGFDKSKNSLFEIHTHVEENGLVFVNLSAGVAEDFDGGNLEKLEELGLKDLMKVGEWKHETTLNWKLVGLLAPDQTKSIASSGIHSFFPSWFRSVNPLDIDIFPTTRVTWYAGKRLHVTIRALPQSATKTIVAYDIYAAGGRVSKKQNLFIEQIKKENSATQLQQLEAIQARLVSGSSTLNDSQAIYQDAIHSILKAHLKLERLSGGEVHPAARQATLSAGGREDDDLCRELESSAAKAVAVDGGLVAGTTGGLNW